MTDRPLSMPFIESSTPCPEVAVITIYPIKSLDGISVFNAEVRNGGGLSGDRRLAIFDRHGKLVNGKSTPAIHWLRARFDLDKPQVEISGPQKQPRVFSLEAPFDPLNEFLSDFFREPVTVKEASSGEFLDDPQQSHVTITSTASLQKIAEQFGFSLAECRRRFRANIELSGVPPFWEEQLVLPAKQGVDFSIGEVAFEGVKPCPRCVVPSRDALTGITTAGFQKAFSEFRKKTIPVWSPLESYGHYYQLAVSCRIKYPNNGRFIQVGQFLKIG